MNQEPELPEPVEAALRRLRRDAAADVDVEAALRRVKARLDEPKVIEFPAPKSIPERSAAGRRRTWLRAAAAAAALLSGTVLWQVTLGTREPAQQVAAQVIASGVGETRTVRLSDGTRVVLAPGSRLVTPAGYGSASRRVELAGEAMFDVVHGDLPFSVRAGHATIRDIGTTFTVRAVEPGVEVAVTLGSVVLHPSTRAEGEGVILQAGDLGVLDAAGRATVFAGRVSEADTAFAAGQLVWRETRLADAASDLQRWYGVTLIIEDPVLAERHLTASFRNEPVQEVLDILGLALGARVELRGDTAFVRAR